MVDDDLIVATVPVCPECKEPLVRSLLKQTCESCGQKLWREEYAWAVRRSEVAPDVPDEIWAVQVKPCNPVFFTSNKAARRRIKTDGSRNCVAAGGWSTCAGTSTT